jgi:ADP-ribose pyrophosphatase YjhB (NUDIX family)
MPAAFSHCPFCGHRFEGEPRWPRECARCGNVTYRNPLPVAVLLLPVRGGGVVCVRRATGARGLALPGGFIELGESWQAAAAREAREETGVAVDPGTVGLVAVRSAPDGTLLVFGSAPPVAASALERFAASDEVSAVEVVDRPRDDMAFPLHADVLAAYLEAAAAGRPPR